MKWYTSICVACGLALLAPQIASAGPKDPPKAGKDLKGAKEAHADKDAKPSKDAKIDAKSRKVVDDEKSAKDQPKKKDVPGELKRVGGDEHKDHRDVVPGQDKKGDRIKKDKKPKAELKPVSDEDVKKIAKETKDANKPSRKKLAEIKATSEDKAYTCAQVKEILANLHNDFDRIEFAESVYENVSDKENWSIVSDALKANWSKKLLEQKIEDLSTETSADDADIAESASENGAEAATE